MKRSLVTATLLGAAALAAVFALSPNNGRTAADAATAVAFDPRLELALEAQVDRAVSVAEQRVAVAAPAVPVDRVATLETIAGLLVAEDFDAVGVAIHGFLSTCGDPTGEVLAILSAPMQQPLDGAVAGLVLQAALRYSLAGADFMGGIEAGDLALLALDCFDQSPYASRALAMGMRSMAAELPGSLVGELVQRIRGDVLMHVEPHTQLDRLHLLRDWAIGMGPDAELALGTLAHDPEASVSVRAGGVLGLMNRDWRRFAPELTEMYADLRARGLTVDSGAGFVLMANLAGTNLPLVGRERLELLREMIGDPEVAAYALTSLPEKLRRELAVYADAGDREWAPYRWVELAGDGDEAFGAGLALLEDTRTDPNVARGYVVVQKLLDLDPTEPRVRDELEWRFSQRTHGDDLFWGVFDFNQDTLPAHVREKDIPHYLAMTRGDTHRTRLRVLERARASHPHLVAGIE